MEPTADGIIEDSFCSGGTRITALESLWIVGWMVLAARLLAAFSRPHASCSRRKQAKALVTVSTLAGTPSLKDTNKALEGDYCSLKAADESKNWRREGKPASAVLVGCWIGLRPLGDMPHNAAPTRREHSAQKHGHNVASRPPHLSLHT